MAVCCDPGSTIRYCARLRPLALRVGTQYRPSDSTSKTTPCGLQRPGSVFVPGYSRSACVALARWRPLSLPRAVSRAYVPEIRASGESCLTPRARGSSKANAPGELPHRENGCTRQFVKSGPSTRGSIVRVLAATVDFGRTRYERAPKPCATPCRGPVRAPGLRKHPCPV